MAEKARHAFGNLERVDAAIQSGAINAYDILFLKDASGKAHIGWIDKEGNKVILQETEKVINVDGGSLPVSGEEGKIYIFNDEGYFWNGTGFVSLSKPANLTTLEGQVNALVSQMENKVDATTVQSMIEEHSESASEVIEF